MFDKSSFRDYLISFSDVVHILKKKRGTILLSGLLGAALFSAYTTTRPVCFEAKASFREKTREEARGDHSVTRVVLGSGSVGSAKAISAMTSREVAMQVIDELSLQAEVRREGTRVTLPQTAKENLQLELAHWMKHETFPRDEPPTLLVQEVQYPGQITRRYTIAFINEKEFNLYSAEGIVAEGILGQPVEFDGIWLTLNGFAEEGERFQLTLKPREALAESLRKQILATEDDEDPSLIRLTYLHSNKRHAEKLLTSLMSAYKQRLLNEYQRLADEQLDYLNTRRQELFATQNASLQQSAETLAHGLASEGFISVDQEMAFLMKNREETLKEQRSIDQELSQLEPLVGVGDFSGVHLLGVDRLRPIHPLLEKMGELKIKKDHLHLLLAESEASIKAPRFEEALKKQEEMEKRLEEIGHVRKVWLKSEEKKPAEEYLTTLERVTEMQKNLTYEGANETQISDLQVAEAQALRLTEEIEALELAKAEYQRLLNALQNPSFEMVSLKANVKDPLLEETSQRVTKVRIKLSDRKNYSQKERARFEEELEKEKDFLFSHLTQAYEQQELQQSILLSKKIALQKAMIALASEQAAVLNKNIADYITTEVKNLQSDRAATVVTLNETAARSTGLPERWMSDQLAKQDRAMNTHVFEQLAHLVENKTVQSHLQMVESTPLDVPYAATLPKSPKIVLFAMVGFFFGLLFASVATVTQAAFSGVEATRENLAPFTEHLMNLEEEDDLRRGLLPLLAEDPQVITTLQANMWTTPLFKQLTQQGKRTLVITFGENPSDLQERTGYDELTASDLFSPDFEKQLHHAKKSYERILLMADFPLTHSKAHHLASFSDSVVLFLTDEKLADLEFYLNLSDKKAVAFFLSVR